MFGNTLGFSTRLPTSGPGVAWAIDVDLTALALAASGGLVSVDGDNDLVFSAELIVAADGTLSFTEVINLDVGDANPIEVIAGTLITSEDVFFLAEPIHVDGGEVSIPGTAAAIALSGDAGPGNLILSGGAGPGNLLVTYLTENLSLTAESIAVAEGALVAQDIQPLALSGDAGPGRIKLSGSAQVSGNDVLQTKETL